MCDSTGLVAAEILFHGQYIGISHPREKNNLGKHPPAYIKLE